MSGSLVVDPVVRLNIALAQTLTEWVSLTVRHGWNAEPLIHNGTLSDILAKSEIGKFTCGTASRLLILAAEQLGFRAREILVIRAGMEEITPASPVYYMSRHRVVEIDCFGRGEQRQAGQSRWILFDPTLNACFLDRQQYATALKLHEVCLSGDAASLVMLQGQPPPRPIGPAYGRSDGDETWKIVLTAEKVKRAYSKLFTLEGCLAYYAYLFYFPSQSWSVGPIEYVGASRKPLLRHHGQSIKRLLGGEYHIATSSEVIYR